MVECDLAKVEVAGSNPVSRSNNLDRARRRFATRTVPSPPWRLGIGCGSYHLDASFASWGPIAPLATDAE